MHRDSVEHRRRFLAATGAAALGLTSGGRAGAAEEEDVSPAEDLMREHGILKRVLLIYRESIRRMDAHADLPPDVLSAAAKLIRNFVEDYHEKL